MRECCIPCMSVRKAGRHQCCQMLPDCRPFGMLSNIIHACKAIRSEPKNWKATTIPVCLHGDEVPVVGVGNIWSRSALVFSFNSLMATFAGRSAEDTDVYNWGCFEKFVMPTTDDGLGAIATFCKLLKWSFSILMAGKWLSHDWQGSKLLWFNYCTYFLVE